ncbi:MAG: hypothetical protein EBQ62_03330 [Alphaproteobacteria bacterium]|jgi:hypothetical protein|nr:hypothetical protein [Rickettsiales bacterium]MCE2730873.1 hypothetical protein [Rickettsiaceae bacterium]NBY35313.1 hypothetical protein [Alphaproteobacteria bacterium]UCM94331.1 MAG: hypothetical protein LF888_01265 [Candidatus Megaira endosymbiont of Mesostigma viride]HJK85602.1 hypothetical protein [Candidatus Megaera endosymbiont of Stentor roeselii]
MRIAKYILIFLVVLLACYCSCWYYIISNIRNDINARYATQKIYVKALVNTEEYFITFDKASITGFPFDMALNLHGWKEESKGALISYHSPIKIGYSFTNQHAYIAYDGEIDAAYKPLASSFGAILKIKNYLIKLDIPLTRKLLSAISKMTDSGELVNYIKGIEVATGGVQITDKQENELFSDKEYEKLNFTFVPAKYYLTLEDLLNEIPSEYTVNYSVKTKPVKFSFRPIPVSLLYGFFNLPSDFSASGKVKIKTEAKKAEELFSNFNAEVEVAFSAPKIDLNSFKLLFKTGLSPEKRKGTALSIDSKIRLKDSFFEELFKKYEAIKPRVISTHAGRLVDQEVSYIISNKDIFRFKDLENSDYFLNLDLETTNNSKGPLVKLNDFSIYSGESGFKLTYRSQFNYMNGTNWKADGVLLIKNYPVVVDFNSNYILRFGDFRFLSDPARNLYIDVNKAFLKQISDYPTSTSNDLSFDYSISTDNWSEGKIGSSKIVQLPELYKILLYKKLFNVIDLHGDILIQIKKLLPNLDENEPVFKKILAQITEKDIKRILPQQGEKNINEGVLQKNDKKATKNLAK